MALEKYFVSHNGEQMGPWNLDEIAGKIRSGQLVLADYIYDEKIGDWVLLMEHAGVSEKVRDHKPQSRPQAAPAKESHPMPSAPEGTPDYMVAEWYVLKGENKFGPFAFADVIKMLQDKVVFEFDFAWHSGLSTWVRIAELDAFKPENIRKLQASSMPEISEVFYRRRHRRVAYNGTILAHDNSTVWKGQGVEISAGGAGVIMENAMIVPGQTLYLHFKPCDGVPPFNAVCEVVSKQFVDGLKERNAPIKYGLKFKSISNNAQKFLQEYSKRGVAA